MQQLASWQLPAPVAIKLIRTSLSLVNLSLSYKFACVNEAKTSSSNEQRMLIRRYIVIKATIAHTPGYESKWG